MSASRTPASSSSPSVPRRSSGRAASSTSSSGSSPVFGAPVVGVAALVEIDAAALLHRGIRGIFRIARRSCPRRRRRCLRRSRRRRARFPLRGRPPRRGGRAPRPVEVVHRGVVEGIVFELVEQARRNLVVVALFGRGLLGLLAGKSRPSSRASSSSTSSGSAGNRAMEGIADDSSSPSGAGTSARAQASKRGPEVDDALAAELPR